MRVCLKGGYPKQNMVCDKLGYPTYFGQSHALTTQGAVKELLLPLANDLVDLPWLSKNLELHRKASTVEK